MKQRIITAIIALAIFIPLVIVGDWPFTILIYLLATIGLMEFINMRRIPVFSFPAILATALLWIILLPQDFAVITWFSKSEFIMAFVLILLGYTVLVKNKYTFDHMSFILMAIIYVGMGFLYLLETRNNGLASVFFVLLIVWATDTGAYFFGRAFGKRKLWPQISPNKTIGGAIGGILLACIVGLIFQLIIPFSHLLPVIIGVTILISIFGQLGDLVESAFKRHYNIKDSGNLLPGHGGILDRFDSLLFVFPMLHFIHFF